MTPERREQIEQICQDALDRHANARAAFVARACGGDEELRREVESLLAHERAAERFIETPALESAAGSLTALAGIAPGEHIGTYEVVSLLGAGGMGEVYRARDPQLGRDVAIKILPPIFSTDPERLARFEREARALAALNHPNVGAIYGLERTAVSRALVLELVDGPTLADTLRDASLRNGSGLALATALSIARQIASALEAAHEKGIVHRDLKPTNIKITPGGTVKVLDFGLAKLAVHADRASELHGAETPRLTLTGARDGVVLGTAAYMSPEQARGQAIDKRTDIWAFGCVLYEMLTGRAAFARETVTDTMAAVINVDPDWSRLPADTPGSIRRLLRRCLRKQPQFRLRDIGDAALEIEEPQGSSPPGRRKVAGWSRRDERQVWAAAAVILLVSTLLLAARLLMTRSREVSPEPRRVTRLMITASSGAEFTVNTGDRVLAISPDGTHLVYVGNAARWQLFVRPLDRLEATPLSDGREAVRGPFFSPDGRWVGYFSSLILRKVPITGGSPVALCNLDGTPRGASWGPDGSIVFATNNTASGLWRISDAGGEATVLTRPDPASGERDHVWPDLLPGGRAVLFTVVPTDLANGHPDIAVLDMRTGARKIVLKRGRNARYLASGHLVYSVGDVFGRAIPRDEAIHAVAFDLDRLEIEGTAVPVLSQVVTTTTPYVDASRDGTLVYMPGPIQSPARSLVWVDRDGREEPINAPARAYEQPRLSPDDKHVAVVARDEELDIWMWDLAGRTALRRFTFGPSVEFAPLWSPDGRRLLFASDRTGTPNVFSQAADGTGPIERLIERSQGVFPLTISPDGKVLVVQEISATPDLMTLKLNRERDLQPLVRTSAVEGNGALSADGRWLAYDSWETGTVHVYVRPFPDVDAAKWQVSTGGGGLPMWARNGEELFYVDPNGALIGVRVNPGATWNPSPPQKVLEPRYFLPMGGTRNYDVSADGKRFLMIKSAEGASASPSQNIIVVQNWFDELKRLVGGSAVSER
jgi:serine/threonine-protein kinase